MALELGNADSKHQPLGDALGETLTGYTPPSRKVGEGLRYAQATEEPKNPQNPTKPRENRQKVLKMQAAVWDLLREQFKYLKVS